MSTARAQGGTSTAGLVVMDGDGRLGYALVTFEEAEISGMELLRRSGAEPVTVTFGGLGEGVCGIGETGCAVDVCRKRMCQTGSPDSPYWQAFVVGEATTWRPLQLGASADRVRDGDVRLWAWTEGAPALPALSPSDISAEVDEKRNQIVWEGGEGDVDDETGSSTWLGIALVGAVGVVAGVVALRARSQPG